MTIQIRRTVASATATLALALALARSDGDDPVTLSVTWWGGDARHSRTQEVLDLFEEKYPNITIEPEFSDWSGYWEKLATATAGGNAPDVIQMDQLYLASYASRDSLVDLGSLPELDTSNLEQSVLDMGKSDNALYGMPISTVAAGLLVNRDLVEEVGVPLPDMSTWSWEEFEVWAQDVTKNSPAGTYGTGIMTYEFTLQNFARQHGDELFDEETIVIRQETMANFFQLALDWTTGGAAPPASATAESAGLPLDQTPMATGNAAAIFVPSTTITAYTAASGAELELVPLPTPDAGVTKYDYFKPGMYWSISSRSQHPAADAFISHMANSIATAG
ncbi:extracellular solute-binding protein [Phytoactinopolyspora alkaliphila]|uniref:Extracellular solute-binding protein n=1 Tax=Phytoactinopolyspora alkaliphila TaxID=1783498 RepID=A0A6N9YQ76_9ACTN|nr:extracellular solute-binding protein [Phytoactinopolyspora alkaliphila]NED97097.1 extracellular solute-binding protein [Phytoactinopolyspora alkaliphila]